MHALLEANKCQAMMERIVIATNQCTSALIPEALMTMPWVPRALPGRRCRTGGRQTRRPPLHLRLLFERS